MSGLDFFVAGTPAAQGSMRAFVMPGKGGKPTARITHASTKTKPWRQALATSALCAMQERRFAMSVDDPLQVVLTFAMQRPKAHYGAKGVKPSAPIAPIKAKDVDKLTRAALDALTGVVYRDDSRVVSVLASKVFAPDGMPAGVRIQVRRVLRQDAWAAYPINMQPTGETDGQGSEEETG